MAAPNTGLATEPSDLGYDPGWTLRPMVPEEAAVLRRHLANPPRPARAGSFSTAFASIAVAVVIGAAAYEGLVANALLRLAFAVIGLAIASAVILLTRVLRLDREAAQPFLDQREAIARALSEGEVEVASFEATGAVRLEDPSEPDCPGFLLQIAEEQILFVQESPFRWTFLRQITGQRRFPCTDFDLVRTPDLGLTLAIHPQGPPLPSARTRAIVSEAEYRPRDGEILSGRLESLDRHLRQWKNEQAESERSDE